MSAIVEIKNVSYAYGKTEALRAISLSIPAGSRYGLIGPNGGGKSTLMKLLSTAMPMQAGEILIAGQSVKDQPARVREALGVVFQTSTLDKKLTIEENLRLMGRLQGLTGTPLGARIDSLLGQLDLTAKKGDRVETLSGGLKRRAELALALLHQPKLLVLDEPTTGLDPLVRREFWNLLSGVMRQQGTSILLATHLLDEAEYCDRLALVHHGKVFAEGTPDSFLAQSKGDILTVTAKDPAAVESWVRNNLQVEPHTVGLDVQFELEKGREKIATLMEKLGAQIDSISLRKAGLENFFIRMVSERQVA